MAKKSCAKGWAARNHSIAHRCCAQHPQDRHICSHPPTTALTDTSSQVNETELQQLSSLLPLSERPNTSFNLIEPSPVMSQNAAAETSS